MLPASQPSDLFTLRITPSLRGIGVFFKVYKKKLNYILLEIYRLKAVELFHNNQGAILGVMRG